MESSLVSPAQLEAFRAGPPGEAKGQESQIAVTHQFTKEDFLHIQKVVVANVVRTLAAVSPNMRSIMGPRGPNAASVIKEYRDTANGYLEELNTKLRNEFSTPQTKEERIQTIIRYFVLKGQNEVLLNAIKTLIPRSGGTKDSKEEQMSLYYGLVDANVRVTLSLQSFVKPFVSDLRQLEAIIGEVQKAGGHVDDQIQRVLEVSIGPKRSIVHSWRDGR